MQVIFTEDGTPGWFGPEPVAGSEALDLKELRALLPDAAPEGGLNAALRDVLVTHRRVNGKWLPRLAGVATKDVPAVADDLGGSGDGSELADPSGPET